MHHHGFGIGAGAAALGLAVGLGAGAVVAGAVLSPGGYPVTFAGQEGWGVRWHLFNQYQQIRNSMEPFYPAGRDLDGADLFICRVFYEGGLHPGKVSRNLDAGHIGWGGLEIISPVYEVLAHAESLYWQPIQNTYEIPGNALQVGNESDGKPLYSARAFVDNSYQVGKTGRHIGGFSVGFGGKEQLFQGIPFEVLCWRVY